MKLWREHYAPQRIALEGESAPLNAVATKSADGKTLYFKAVNPSDEAVPVVLKLAGGAAGKATLQVVAPGDLHARNTLEARDAVQAQACRRAARGSRRYGSRCRRFPAVWLKSAKGPRSAAASCPSTR